MRKLLLLPLLMCLYACGTEPTPTYTITASSSPAEGGLVVYAPAGSPQDKGTSLTFTATPSEGYVFSQWQGDMSGSSNPANMVLSKNVIIKGVFEKKTYPLTITIEGDGTVKEEVIQAKTDYEHGTRVRLTPQPADGWEFKAWTGDIESTEAVQEVTVTEPININLQFNKKYIPQKIYNTSVQNHEWNNGWYNELNDGIRYGGTSTLFILNAATYFDYDNDGDFDMFTSVEYLYDILGNQIPDTEGLNVLLINNGTLSNGKIIWTSNMNNIPYQSRYGYRKLIPADLNNDGYIDIVGFNATDPGENIPASGGIDIFWNDGQGKFKIEVIIPMTYGMNSFFHGGTAGDVNNDGWVDIITAGAGTQVFLNEGGTFKTAPFGVTVHMPDGWGVAFTLNVELFDINQDGYNDLIIGAAKNFDHTWYDRMYTDSDYANHTEIFFGKPDYPYYDFKYNYILKGDYDYSSEPDWKTSNKTFMGAVDWAIHDYDGDGDYDLFVTLMREQPTETFDQAMVSYYENIDNQKWESKTKEVFGDYEWFHRGGISYIKLWDIDNDGDKELLIENTVRTGFTGWDKKQDGKLYKSLIKN